MARYLNLNGDSGVFAYDIASDSIAVQFSDGSKYLYTYSSTGQPNVEHMKTLAQQGRGLNSFINAHVKKLYSRRLQGGRY